MASYNVKLRVDYLCDNGRDLVVNRVASGSFRGVRFNGSLRKYFISLFKDNIDDVVVEENDLSFVIKNRSLLKIGVMHAAAFKLFNKTLRGYAREFSNSEFSVSYEVVRV